TLPLMLAYAKRARASITEGLFLWFAFCTAAYMKDFSYLRWPGAPLFVTDVILVVLLLSIYLLSRPHHSRSPLELNIFLLLFVTLGIMLLIGLLYGRTADGQGRLGRTPATLLMPTILIILASSLFLHTQSGRDFTQRSTEELDSGVLHSGEDPNWQFRVAAWKEAWRRFEEYPLAGEGFGIPFVFGIWDNDPRPHNTFLTVLYKMGLIGFIPLLAFLCYFFWLASRAVYRNRKNHRTLFLLIAVMGQMAFCVYGMANFVLESPFLASL